MAYLMELGKCQDCKTRPQQVEVFGWQNNSLGRFCRGCGGRRVRRQEHIEVENWKLIEAAPDQAEKARLRKMLA